MYCTRCGAELVDGTRFCTGCGAPIAVRESESHNRKAPLVVALVAVALVGVTAAALVLPRLLGTVREGDGAQTVSVQRQDEMTPEGDLPQDGKPVTEQTGTAEGAGTHEDVEPKEGPQPVPDTDLETVGLDRPYVNGRYGYRIDLPASFEAGPEPANGDGQTFWDPASSMVVSVWGSNNVFAEDAQTFMEDCGASAKVDGYEASGDGWFVSSWREGDQIEYVKGFVGEGSVCIVRFSYSTDERDAGAAFLERAVKTFEPGDLTTAH